MTKTISRCLLSLALGFSVISSAAPAPSHYLFVWAMEAEYPRASTMALMSADPAERRKTQGLGKDFLAVFDIRPGVSFGSLVTMLPVGDAAMAHHTNYAEPPDDVLYANDWAANRTYVFDLRNPEHPRLARQFGSVGAYSYPHSFVYLSNGNTLATFQYSGGFNHGPGGWRRSGGSPISSCWRPCSYRRRTTGSTTQQPIRQSHARWRTVKQW